jgi:uncharacterized protein (TIGR02145 family)
MATNLKTEHFNDNSDIPMGGVDPTFFTDAEWAALVTPGMCYYNNDTVFVLSDAYCWYNNDIANKTVYGALYNWLAVDKANGLVYFERGGTEETGWHIPTTSEWETFSYLLDGDTVAGGNAKEIGTTHWTSPNTGATDLVGFTAEPGGYRDIISGDFGAINIVGVFWGTVQVSPSGVTVLALYNDSAEAHINKGIATYNTYGFSVRCVRNIYTGTIYVIYTDGTSIFRKGVRDHALVIDKAITATGFSGVEDTDWVNLKAIMQ